MADQAPTERFGAIDLGSNGLRMAVGEPKGDGAFEEIVSSRAAVRLGHDSFHAGSFSAATIARATSAVCDFRDELDSHGVKRVRAVATSATRDAANSDDLVRSIRDATGIAVEVIDPIEEARLMYRALTREVDMHNRTALLIDMGGGSVQIAVVRDGRALGAESLRLGPVRILERLRVHGLPESEAAGIAVRYRGVVAGFLRSLLESEPLELCVGTGGNIRALSKLRGTALGKRRDGCLTAADVRELNVLLAGISSEQREQQFDLRSDRADVISIAAIVMGVILDDAGVDSLQAVEAGLKEGMLADLAAGPVVAV